MRVYWYQGGLHIEPESKSETDLLSRLVKCLKFEPEKHSYSGTGETDDLAIEFGLQGGISAENLTPRSLPSEGGNKHTVICINERC